MTTDHSEFIARHHKEPPPEIVEPPKKNSSAGLWFVFIPFLFAAVFLFLAIFADLDEVSRLIDIIAFLSASAVGFVAWRSYKIHERRDVALDLVHEVMEGSRGGRLITDSADNTVYYNKRFERLCMGVGPVSLATLTRLFENNDEGAMHFRLLSENAHRGQTDSVELFSKYEDRERWLLVTAQPVQGYAGYVHWRVDDVTQKHTVDRGIREEREKLIDFTDNAPVGFFSVDERGRFVFANATFARWVGEDLRVILEQGTLHTYLVNPPKGGKPYDILEESSSRQVVEVQMKGAAGKTFLASVNQVVVVEPDGHVRTRAVIHDLTAEREMRQALQASEDRFQRFFEEAPLGIIQVDEDGNIADCNHAFASMLNTPLLDIEGTCFEDFITHNEERDTFLAAMDRIEQGKIMEAPMEISLNGKGATSITQMYARKFRGGGNVVLHFIDVTEQKSLEAQFVQSQKMQAIGQLAGGIAHDFNNLLTAIIGFSDLLLLRHKPGDPSFGDIMQIKQNSNRAANLVRQLLAFSRQQTLRPKVQDVTDILTELSHLIRRLIGAGIELDIRHGDELGLVRVDEGQMEQVLINLAVNGRDAMEEAGKLTIQTENFTNKKPVELVSEELPPGHWTLIKVSDTGCGIAKENMARIFEPFYTTKDVGEGTGLGLATVYGIVRQTGGFLDVQSELSEGTTFLLYLPRATEAEEEASHQDEQEGPEGAKDLTGTERILLVEDEDAVRTFSVRALANKGYEVLGAESGEAGLAEFKKDESKKLDLLITDVVMPGMDGPTMAAKIRQNNPELKIIFMSGYTEDKLKDHMDANTFFLPKPFTLKQLAAKVKDVLGE